MPTYLIGKEIAITRQEGDVADIVVTVPDILSMDGKTARFQVRDAGNRMIINKDQTGIDIDGQIITIELQPADTSKKSGKYRWELEVADDDGPITIGRGNFDIVKTMIL
jgi:hypothetical protein